MKMPSSLVYVFWMGEAILSEPIYSSLVSTETELFNTLITIIIIIDDRRQTRTDFILCTSILQFQKIDRTSR